MAKLNYVPSWLTGTHTLLERIDACIKRVEDLASMDITELTAKFNEYTEQTDARLDRVDDDLATHAAEIEELTATVGDTENGLVKDVADLETTVGDSNSGLVKDVADLETTVGDSESGLVKDVADLKDKKLYIHKITCGDKMLPEQDTFFLNLVILTNDETLSNVQNYKDNVIYGSIQKYNSVATNGFFVRFVNVGADFVTLDGNLITVFSGSITHIHTDNKTEI